MAKAKGSRSGRTLAPLVVRYPRRMRPQKVYSVTVSWREKPKAAGTAPFVVRLVMPGTQVVPSERTMDPARPSDRAIFYVTSLARRGWLKGERVEVLRDGEKVQEIPLPAKVATQRATWILLLLTFLIPWFLVTHIQQTSEEFDASGALKGAWNTVIVPYFENNTPPLLYDATQDFGLQGAKEGVDDFLDSAFGSWYPNSFDWVYRIVVRDEVYTLTGAHRAYLPFWTVVVLLLFTLISCHLHREKIRRTVGQPLPAAAED